MTPDELRALVTEDDIKWAEAEARKLAGKPHPKTRPFQEWRAALRSRAALEQARADDGAPHPSPEQKGSEQ